MDPTPSVWTGLRHPVFRALWASGGVYFIGDAMKTMAAAWLTVELPARTFSPPTEQTAVFLPMFLFALPAGVLADNRRPRRLMLGYDHHLRKIRRVFADQVWQMTEAMTSFFPEGTRVTRPLGGFVAWVELPCDIDTMALYDDAVAQDFSFAPGRLFSSTDRYRNCLRLSCGHPGSAAREAAVVRLGQLIKV